MIHFLMNVWISNDVQHWKTLQLQAINNNDDNNNNECTLQHHVYNSNNLYSILNTTKYLKNYSLATFQQRQPAICSCPRKKLSTL